MSYWIFQANPKRYNILEAVADRDEISWTINQHTREIHSGDGVLIWKAGDDAGIYGIAEVVSEPAVSSSDDPLWMEEDKDWGSSPRLRATLRIAKRLVDRPILRSTLANDPSLRSLSILRFTQGTNFPVSEQEWERIISFAGIAPTEQTAAESDQRLDVAETHLRQAIARNLSQIAPDLVPYFDERVEEYPIPGGRIDLLCKDGDGVPVIVEIKRQHWDTDKAIGQITRYMGWAKATLADGGAVRGILLILDEGSHDQRLELTAAALPGLEVRRYSISLKVS